MQSHIAVEGCQPPPINDKIAFMRIQIHDLQTQLNRGLAPLYFVWGEEPLQHQEALDGIRAAAKNAGYTEREILDITPNFDWNILQNTLHSLSLFSTKRVIECRLADGKLGKMGAELIKGVQPLPIDTLLIISAGKIESAVQKSVWFTTLERLGISLCSRSLNPEEMTRWITQRFTDSGLKSTPALTQVLLERTEGNLLAASQAIEKLKLFSNSADLTPQTLEAVVGMDARYSLFDLVDAVIEGSKVRTSRIFNGLKKEGIEPILILWAITREVRTINPILKVAKRGLLTEDTFTQYGVWKHRRKRVGAFVRRTSLQKIHQFILQAKKIDDILKGRTSGDAWDGLFRLCLDIAGVSYE